MKRIWDITGYEDFYFLYYFSVEHERSLFVYDKKNDKKYDLKNGFVGENGKNHIIYSFGDGDYFYLKERSDEEGVELNPIVGILTLER